MNHDQILAAATPPPLSRRVGPYIAVAVARVLARLSPRRLRAVLTLLRRGAAPADHARALRAREAVTAVSTRCAGRYCLQRSLATAVLCRLTGTWPTWCTGVRTAPTAAHAWVEAEGRPVGEPPDTATYHTLLTVPPVSDA
ncbi:lasso peptide biosynthesis B2 protein [Nocardia blacklockiae]|uniref:lasso peptide biosynthesis B2 protein n=1 Tax=Nocardia blacklockiae TaxID=480036 RepID=UPI001896385E|nr:lasso peptide biosynthesis B2 protein [Nocardia blacklockiae]MBF6175024.1 lasso peptide biosynthesis B2 protein [Nocardia blacklockiae]